MRILLRIVAGFCVLIAAFLVYAVVAALAFAASRLWNSRGSKPSAP